MPFKLNPTLRSQIASGLASALTEIDLRIETEAKKELYRGHGKRTGTLQRSIQGAPATVQGNRIRGKVGTKGVRYALRIHKRYGYLAEGIKRVRPQVQAILKKHMK